VGSGDGSGDASGGGDIQDDTVGEGMKTKEDGVSCSMNVEDGGVDGSLTTSKVEEGGFVGEEESVTAGVGV